MKAYTKPEFEYVLLTPVEEIMSVPDTSYGTGTPPNKLADNYSKR